MDSPTPRRRAPKAPPTKKAQSAGNKRKAPIRSNPPTPKTEIAAGETSHRKAKRKRNPFPFVGRLHQGCTDSFVHNLAVSRRIYFVPRRLADFSELTRAPPARAVFMCACPAGASQARRTAFSPPRYLTLATRDRNHHAAGRPRLNPMSPATINFAFTFVQR